MQHSQRLEDMSAVDHFAWLTRGIRILVGDRPTRVPALMLLIGWRLIRAQRRFNALVAKIEAGKVLAPLKRRTVAARATEAPATDTPATGTDAAAWTTSSTRSGGSVPW